MKSIFKQIHDFFNQRINLFYLSNVLVVPFIFLILILTGLNPVILLRYICIIYSMAIITIKLFRISKLSFLYWIFAIHIVVFFFIDLKESGFTHYQLVYVLFFISHFLSSPNFMIKTKKNSIMAMLFFVFSASLTMYYGNDIHDFIAIDSCLDNGNTWDYANRTCVQSGVSECLKSGGKWSYSTNLCTQDQNIANQTKKDLTSN